MKLTDCLQEVAELASYKSLKEKNLAMTFCAFFLIRDLEKNLDKIQLDFFLPEEKKIAVFEHPFFDFKISEDKIESIESQSTQLVVDIDRIEQKTLNCLMKNKIEIVPNKIIAILKNNVWNVTVMDKFLSVVRVKIDAASGKEISVEKKGIFDFVKIEKK